MTAIPVKLSTDSENTTYDFKLGGSDYQLIHKRPPHPKLVLKKADQIAFQIIGGQDPVERKLQTDSETQTLLIGLRAKAQKPLFSATPHPSLLFEVNAQPLQYTLTDPSVGRNERRIPILLLSLFFMAGAAVRIIPEIVTVGMFLDALLANALNIAAGAVLAVSAWKSSDYPGFTLGIASFLAAKDLLDSANTAFQLIESGQMLNPLNVISFLITRFIVIYFLYHSITFEFKRRITPL